MEINESHESHVITIAEAWTGIGTGTENDMNSKMSSMQEAA